MFEIRCIREEGALNAVRMVEAQGPYVQLDGCSRVSGFSGPTGALDIIL